MDRMRERLKGLSAWVVFASLIATFACDNESNEITGTYNAAVFESEDTCDGERDGPYPLQFEIARQGDGFSVLVNGAGPLTGDIREDGILAVVGTVTGGDPPCSGSGACPRQVQLEMDIRRGRIVEGAALITWNGTFPGVPGACVQELTFTGSRQDLAPIIG
jgi:hypothetical protein